MRRSTRVAQCVAACGVAVGAGFLGTSATAAASSGSPSSVTVVASHLGNPRGLSFGDDGKLYVAEAGRGNGNHCVSDPEMGSVCVGQNGAIDAIGADGTVTPVVTGLISVAGPDGSGAEGMVAVSASGGTVYGQFGGNTFGIPTSGLPTFLQQNAHRELGQFGMASGAAFANGAGVGDYDYIWSNAHKELNPQFPDSNPNGVLVTGGRRFVVDAGANTLDEVRPDGTVDVLTYFDVPAGSPTDAVPTCVAKGPDGALYVGELLGGDFAPGHARVWRVDVSGAKATKSVWARGLTTVQGCGFDPAGNFYATEFQINGLGEGPTSDPTGALVKIAPDGSRSNLGVGSLFVPSGFAAGPDGSLYVSNCSIAPPRGFGPCRDGGAVVKVTS